MASLFTDGATPRFIALGTDDKSVYLVTKDAESYPQHLPKFYTFAQRGKTGIGQIVSGAVAKQLFGEQTFDPDGRFWTHQSMYANDAMGAGQDVMIQRVVPEDIGPRANLSLYVDYMETDVPNYLRDSKGMTAKDQDGNPIVDPDKPTVPGLKLKWITDYNTETEPTQAGLLEPKAGTMSGSVTVMVDDPNGETEEIEVVVGTEERQVKVGSHMETRGTGQFETVTITTDIIDHYETRGTGEFKTEVKHFNYFTLPETETVVTPDTLENIQNTIGADNILFPRAITFNGAELLGYTHQADAVTHIDDVTGDTVIDTPAVEASLFVDPVLGELLGYRVEDAAKYLVVGYTPYETDTNGDFVPGAAVSLTIEDGLKLDDFISTIGLEEIVKEGTTAFTDFTSSIQIVRLINTDTADEAIPVSLNDYVQTLAESNVTFDNIVNAYDSILGKVVAAADGYDREEQVEITEEFPVYKTEEVEREIMEEVEVDDFETQTVEIKETQTRIKQVPQVTTTSSRMIPVLEMRAKDYGSWYNNIGFSINSQYLTNFNSELAKKLSLMVYTMCLYTRADERSSAEVFRSLYSENEIEMVITTVPTKDPLTTARVDMPYIYASQWYNETSTRLAYKPYTMEDPYIYMDNFNTLLRKMLDAERKLIEFDPKLYTADNEYAANIDWYDFADASEDADLDPLFGLLNPFTCKTSKNVKLQATIISTDRPTLTGNMKEVDMSTDKALFLQGGTDGDLSRDSFEKAVIKEIAKYGQEDAEVQDMSFNVESAFWDSGFKLENKYKLLDFISLRRDVFLVLSTQEYDGPELGTADSRAIAVALNTRLKLFPESTFFGTGVARAIIVIGSGRDIDDADTKVIPQSRDLLIKTARFAGAGNGKWNKAYLFDRGATAVITSLKDIKPEFIPQTAKPALWYANSIWSQRFDRSNYFFPAIQTVYDNETSVLNSYFTIMAVCTSNKVGFEAWKNFTGSISLSNDEFKTSVETFVTNRMNNIFAGVVNAVPECIIDDYDKVRGYSWHLKIKLESNNMKTVQVFNTETYRMGEIAASRGN